MNNVLMAGIFIIGLIFGFKYCMIRYAVKETGQTLDVVGSLLAGKKSPEETLSEILVILKDFRTQTRDKSIKNYDGKTKKES